MRANYQPDLSMLTPELRVACLQYLNGLNLDGGSAIISVHTLDEFIIVYYQSMQYLQSGDVADAVAGNCPLFVDTRNNTVYLQKARTQIEECVQAAREGRIDSLLTRII